MQLGLVHPSIVQAAKTVFEDPVVVVNFVVPLPRIIPWAIKVDMMSAELVMEYKEGITDNHFADGIDLIKIPLQVSSNIA